MAIKLKRLDKGVKIYFYDPNDTIRTTNFLISDMDRLPKLKMESFTSKYFSKGLDAAYLASTDASEAGENPAAEIYENSSRKNCSPGMINILLSKGILRKKHLPSSIDDLIGEFDTSTFSKGIYRDTQYGYINEVEIFIDFVLNSRKLSSREQFDILNSEVMYGMSPFGMACLRKNKEMVRAFLKKILRSSLDEKHILKFVTKFSEQGS